MTSLKLSNSPSTNVIICYTLTARLTLTSYLMPLGLLFEHRRNPESEIMPVSRRFFVSAFQSNVPPRLDVI